VEVAVQKEVQNFGLGIEEAYGFAEAVRVEETIYISGQTAFSPEGRIEGEGDMAAQMRQAYANIGALLARYDAGFENVVEEVLYVTDIAAAGAVAHSVRSEVFAGRFEVASSLIGVQALGAPQLLIEIRCTARI
jgi:enamine deaminase RidA (YjgF/YER057c/UK114 family)